MAYIGITRMLIPADNQTVTHKLASTKQSPRNEIITIHHDSDFSPGRLRLLQEMEGR